MKKNILILSSFMLIGIFVNAQDIASDTLPPINKNFELGYSKSKQNPLLNLEGLSGCLFLTNHTVWKHWCWPFSKTKVLQGTTGKEYRKITRKRKRHEIR